MSKPVGLIPVFSEEHKERVLRSDLYRMYANQYDLEVVVIKPKPQKIEYIIIDEAANIPSSLFNEKGEET